MVDCYGKCRYTIYHTLSVWAQYYFISHLIRIPGFTFSSNQDHKHGLMSRTRGETPLLSLSLPVIPNVRIGVKGPPNSHLLRQFWPFRGFLKHLRSQKAAIPILRRVAILIHPLAVKNRRPPHEPVLWVIPLAQGWMEMRWGFRDFFVLHPWKN